MTKFKKKLTVLRIFRLSLVEFFPVFLDDVTGFFFDATAGDFLKLVLFVLFLVSTGCDYFLKPKRFAGFYFKSFPFLRD